MTIPSVMEVCSNALRGIIVAPSGYKLVAADLSNIEGRVLAWLAGEEWKLEAFRAFDAGTGPDLYVLAYAGAFHMDPADVSKGQRQIGKGLELSMGYEGGVGAFLKINASYGLDINKLTEAAWPGIPEQTKLDAMGAYEWATEKRRTYGLPMRSYVVCDSLKRLWRAAHPAITTFWTECRAAACRAILDGVSTHVNDKLYFERKANWLRVRLPSGRYLCYPSPKVDEAGKISYFGINQYTHKWGKISTYGGKFAENATQAVARDVMADAMPHAEAAGYKIVMHCHDELVAEVPDDATHGAEELAYIMSRCPRWADGLPLAAAGTEGYRYGK